MDDLTLKIGNRRLSGWTDIRVTRGCERCPNDFEIGLTEKYPGQALNVVVQPGDACQVLLGNDLVITGYVDRYTPSINMGGHTIKVSGRGRCQDLVDSAGEWPGGQISGATALVIAQKLASYMTPVIKVTATGDVGPIIPQFNLMNGESAFEIIERVCRFHALLAYELPDGNLHLSRVGTKKHSSGIVQGQNVQEASITYSQDQRFSEYVALIQSVETLGDAGSAGNLLATVYDKNIKRHRRKVIISEGGGLGNDVAIARANWERSRRFGRSAALTVTLDNWRDSAGLLWTPNQLVPISLPSLKLAAIHEKLVWIISEVAYHRDRRGTRAELVLMPPEAFQPEPVLLQNFIPDAGEHPKQ